MGQTITNNVSPLSIQSSSNGGSILDSNFFMVEKKEYRIVKLYNYADQDAHLHLKKMAVKLAGRTMTIEQERLYKSKIIQMMWANPYRSMLDWAAAGKIGDMHGHRIPDVPVYIDGDPNQGPEPPQGFQVTAISQALMLRKAKANKVVAKNHLTDDVVIHGHDTAAYVPGTSEGDIKWAPVRNGHDSPGLKLYRGQPIQQNPINKFIYKSIRFSYGYIGGEGWAHNPNQETIWSTTRKADADKYGALSSELYGKPTPGTVPKETIDFTIDIKLEEIFDAEIFDKIRKERGPSTTYKISENFMSPIEVFDIALKNSPLPGDPLLYDAYKRDILSLAVPGAELSAVHKAFDKEHNGKALKAYMMSKGYKGVVFKTHEFYAFFRETLAMAPGHIDTYQLTHGARYPTQTIGSGYSKTPQRWDVPMNTYPYDVNDKGVITNQYDKITTTNIKISPATPFGGVSFATGSDWIKNKTMDIKELNIVKSGDLDKVTNILDIIPDSAFSTNKNSMKMTEFFEQYWPAKLGIKEIDVGSALDFKIKTAQGYTIIEEFHFSGGETTWKMKPPSYPDLDKLRIANIDGIRILSDKTVKKGGFSNVHIAQTIIFDHARPKIQNLIRPSAYHGIYDLERLIEHFTKSDNDIKHSTGELTKKNANSFVIDPIVEARIRDLIRTQIENPRSWTSNINGISIQALARAASNKVSQIEFINVAEMQNKHPALWEYEYTKVIDDINKAFGSALIVNRKIQTYQYDGKLNEMLDAKGFHISYLGDINNTVIIAREANITFDRFQTEYQYQLIGSKDPKSYFAYSYSKDDVFKVVGIFSTSTRDTSTLVDLSLNTPEALKMKVFNAGNMNANGLLLWEALVRRMVKLALIHPALSQPDFQIDSVKLEVIQAGEYRLLAGNHVSGPMEYTMIGDTLEMSKVPSVSLKEMTLRIELYDTPHVLNGEPIKLSKDLVPKEWFIKNNIEALFDKIDIHVLGAANTKHGVIPIEMNIKKIYVPKYHGLNVEGQTRWKLETNPLHNEVEITFKLLGSGEDLVITMPDGSTKSSFSPQDLAINRFNAQTVEQIYVSYNERIQALDKQIRKLLANGTTIGNGPGQIPQDKIDWLDIQLEQLKKYGNSLTGKKAIANFKKFMIGSSQFGLALFGVVTGSVAAFVATGTLVIGGSAHFATVYQRRKDAQKWDEEHPAGPTRWTQDDEDEYQRSDWMIGLVYLTKLFTGNREGVIIWEDVFGNFGLAVQNGFNKLDETKLVDGFLGDTLDSSVAGFNSWKNTPSGDIAGDLLIDGITHVSDFFQWAEIQREANVLGRRMSAVASLPHNNPERLQVMKDVQENNKVLQQYNKSTDKRWQALEDYREAQKLMHAQNKETWILIPE